MSSRVAYVSCFWCANSYSPPRRDLCAPSTDTKHKPPNHQLHSSRQWRYGAVLTVPTMSSSSHKCHRSSQQDIRKAYASRGTVDRHASEAKQESSVHIAGMESLASSRTNVSDGQSDAVQPTPVPPFITPHAKATVDSYSTMVSTMVPTAGTSDLSTTTSNASAPPPRPRPEPTPHLSNQSNESNPSTNNRAQPLFIDLWHNRDSVGQIQFGTQSSPQKALKLLAAMERTVPAEASNGEDP